MWITATVRVVVHNQFVLTKDKSESYTVSQHANSPKASPGLTKQVLALAVPALGALIAEPVFVLIDSAVVGRLGASELAGLALASAVLMTAVGLNVYLAYATTAAVARHIGAGERLRAMSLAVDGHWLALIRGEIGRAPCREKSRARGQ